VSKARAASNEANTDAVNPHALTTRITENLSSLNIEVCTHRKGRAGPRD